MSGSYEAINYAIRPNKRTQRKLIFDALARYVSTFHDRKFRYVGFGSMWFSDFLYAHRHLGLTDLTSIERAAGYKRALFNRPFKCIKIRSGESTVVLPEMKWSSRSIVWLDYDYVPESQSLQDIAFLAGKLQSSSVLIVSYNAAVPWKENDPWEARAAAVRKIFSDAAPRWTSPDSDVDPKAHPLNRIQYPQVLTAALWSMLANLLVQNGRAAQEQLTWQPLFSFRYKDGAPMVTVGGALLNAADAVRVADAKLSSHLPYLKADESSEICLPPLTPKERTEIDRRLPRRKVKLPFPLPTEQLESYRQLYRYFPMFAEIEP